jgi:hypothetical protein
MSYIRKCRFCGNPLAPERTVPHCPNCTPKKRAIRIGIPGKGRKQGHR